MTVIPNQCAATHRSKVCIRIILILMSLWPVAVTPVRINTLTHRFKSKLFEIIVWIANISISSLLILENTNGEDTCKVMPSNAVNAGLHDPLSYQPSLKTGITSKVDACKRNLWTLSRFKCIQIMIKSLCCLFALTLQHIHSILINSFIEWLLEIWIINRPLTVLPLI